MNKIFYWLILLVPLLCAFPAKANDLSQIDRSFIIRQEGLVLFPYKDIAHYKTICVGHLVKNNEKVKASYTMEECLSIFEKDLTLFVIQNNECLSFPQNNNQFTAIIDFQFNLGTAAACKSSLFRDIGTNKSISIINNDFLKWKYVTINGKLVVNDSILNRRKREVERYNLK